MRPRHVSLVSALPLALPCIPLSPMKSSNGSLLLMLVATLAWAQAIPCGFAADTATAPKSPESKPLDPGWPREVTRNGVRLVAYQPQVDEWNNFRELRARFAFTLTPKDGKPAVGIEEVRADTRADLQTRTVLIDNIEIVAVRFPSLPAEEQTKLEQLLRSTFPGRSVTVSFDRLVAGIQASQQRAKPVSVKTDPPPIFVSSEPAILLIVPDKPVRAPINGVSLDFVVNTNWDLFFAPSTSHYYLLVDKLWLMADSPDGAWHVAKTLPTDFSKLPSNENWDRVKKAVPPAASGTAKAPKVFYSTVPAEFIAFAGAPAYKKIEGTQLAYATNTDSWVFKNAGDGQLYYLVTGRWFRAPQLEGPWSYAGNDLPGDFQRIPANSDAAEVLSSVPGTSEAEDTVLLAQVPTWAVVNRAEAEAQVKVEYNGDPQFAPIEGTSLSYATNTSSVVIRVEDKYYLCANGVWFVSTSPTGPWTTATEVPEAVYSIPPSSPVYHATYVKVEGSNEKQVTCSYTAGYSGAYVAGVATGAALVWGTGYYYPPYVYPAPVPIYYPYYATYGVAANYYPATGFYGVGGYAYGPYGGAGTAAWYNPSTGAYGRAYTNQYPYGGRTSAWGYNPSTNTSWTTQQGHNYYSQWGTSTVERGGETYQAGHVVTPYGSTGVAKGPNNLYAAHDGNVYKRDDSGNWSKYENGGWQPVTPPSKGSTPTQPSTLGAQNKPTGSPGGTNQPQNLGSSGGSKPTAQNERQNRPAKRSTGGGTQQPSDELTNGLDREATARKQGSERANQYQRRLNSSRWSAERGSRGGWERFRGRE